MTCGATRYGLSGSCPSSRRNVILAVREVGGLRRPKIVVVRRPSWHCDSASLFHITERLLMLVQQPEDVYDPEAELETLRYWLGVDRFDRRRLNQELRQDAPERATATGMSPEVLR